MSIQKIDQLIIGKGGLTDNTKSVRQMTSTYKLGTWSISLSYSIDTIVEYSSKYYRSLVGSNLGNQPDISPTQWELYNATVQDGDIAYIVPGSTPNPNSDIMIRNDGRWISIIGIPILAALADNTLAQAFALIPSTVAKSATLEYTIDRTPNLRRGTLRYSSDGTAGPTGVNIADYDCVDIGTGNVGVTFDATIDGSGNVQITADTDSQGLGASVKYVIKGWT